jgi:membrane protease YdiL (CAAX protease family)
MQTDEQAKHVNSFGPLGAELKRRFLAPVGQVSFWVFFLLGVVFFSASGVWVELGKYGLDEKGNLDGVRTAIYTFFPALACTATMQIIFSEDDKKYMRSLGYAAGLLLILIGIGLLAFDRLFSPTESIVLGTFASIIAILTWWIANGYEQMFYDNLKGDESTGGDPGAPLKGSTSGLKTS